MKRFILGLLGFVVVWIAGLAPQFLAYAHVPGIIIFALEGGVSIAGYLFWSDWLRSAPHSNSRAFASPYCRSGRSSAWFGSGY
jgi:hypothetical protein